MDEIRKPAHRYKVLSKDYYRRYSSKDKSEGAKPGIAEINEAYHGSYKALLFDSRWKEKRSVILIRDNYKCIICESTTGLQVHHRQYHYSREIKAYKPPWEYNNYLLITLCEKCHQKGHRQYLVPTVYIK